MEKWIPELMKRVKTIAEDTTQVKRGTRGTRQYQKDQRRNEDSKVGTHQRNEKSSFDEQQGHSSDNPYVPY